MAFYLWLQQLLRDEEGQDLIEYSLIIVLVVIVAIVGLSAVGGSIAGIWGQITGALGGGS
jgi:Flp pilus assembly pilin Flp